VTYYNINKHRYYFTNAHAYDAYQDNDCVHGLFQHVHVYVNALYVYQRPLHVHEYGDYQRAYAYGYEPTPYVYGYACAKVVACGVIPSIIEVK